MHLINKLQTSLLADDLHCVDSIAQWYYDQWLKYRANFTLSKVKESVALSTSRLGPPLIVLAKVDDELAGAAQLKIREMSIYPQFEHWVGGVYVDSRFRDFGIAATLVQEVLAQAQKAGITTLYLQTEKHDGGLYAKLGFSPIEQVNYEGHEVLVMKYEFI